MELVVVMIITIAVASVTYKSFDIVAGQYRRFKNDNEHTHELLLLETLLVRDFNASDYVLRVSGGIACVYKNKDIRYYFDEGYIVRKQRLVYDTFHIDVSNISYRALDNSQGATGRYVDRLSFETDASGEPLPFTYTKRYGADVLMRQGLKEPE